MVRTSSDTRRRISAKERVKAKSNRCDFCGGPFGLIRHRTLTHQFCRLSCKSKYLQRRMRQVAARKRMLAEALSLSVYDRLFGAKEAPSRKRS